jgi:hypothetical protein
MSVEKVYKSKTLEELRELYKDKVSEYDLYLAYHQVDTTRNLKREKYHKKKERLLEQIKEAKEEIKKPPPPSLPEPSHPPIIKDTKVKKLKN